MTRVPVKSLIIGMSVHTCIAWLFLVTTASAVLLIPQKAHAMRYLTSVDSTESKKTQHEVEQPDSAQSNRLGDSSYGVSTKSFHSMSREELKESGFVFDDASKLQSRASASMLALTIGTLVHGVGHWAMGDNRTALVLLGTQSVGMGLIVSGILADYRREAYNDHSQSPSVARSSLVSSTLFMGTALFISSYLMDIIGTMYGDELGIPENNELRRGVTLASRYIYLDDELNSIRHAMTAELRADLGRYYVAGRTFQDVLLDALVFGGNVGLRPWQGTRQLTYVFTEADLEYLNYRGHPNVARYNFEGRAGISLDLGMLFEHFEQVAIGMSAGYGYRRRGWQSIRSGSRKPFENPEYIPLEVFLHFNPTDRIHFRVSGVHSPESLLQTLPSQLGVASVTLSYRSTDRFDMTLNAQYGEGIALSGGLAIWLWE